MKVIKSKFKVLSCKEFECPFFHAGIMGQITCNAANRELDTSDHNKPPEWCPLRSSSITVKL